MDITPLFKVMADKGASDLFFSVGTPIHIKIEGVTLPINNQVPDALMVKKMAYGLMSKEQITAFETNLEMNFSFYLSDVGNFRVNVFRQRGEVGMVVRHIKAQIPEIRSLQLPEILETLIMEKRGLILMVGATGSGKSTTLAAMLDFRNTKKTGHILTVEDPIEFIYKHKKSMVNQREVGMDTKSYHNALMNAMREAPDVLLIGEILDRETMQHAMNYAQSGHLCVSTMHANNSYHALTRIINFFPHEAREALLLDLSLALKAIISQRLVKGLNGPRVPAVEVLVNTTHISELIEKGKIQEIKEAMEKSLTAGSQTFEQALYQLCKAEKISKDDALANADSATNLAWIFNNAEGKPAAAQEAATQNPEAGGKDSGLFSGFALNVDATEH